MFCIYIPFDNIVIDILTGLVTIACVVCIFGGFVLLYVLLMIIVGVLKEKNIMVRERLTEGNPLKKYVVYYLLLMMIVIFGIYGAGYNASDFIYGQF